MMPTQWIETAGGPLVMMSRPLLRTWRGIYRPTGEPQESATGSYTDYERACQVMDEIGTITGGGVHVLVLGDEPDRTMIRDDGDGVVIIRWRAAESEQALEEASQRLLPQLPFEAAGTFHTFPGEHLLFDSARTGWDAGDSLACTLPHPVYVVESAMLRDSGTEALIHRLQPA